MVEFTMVRFFRHFSPPVSASPDRRAWSTLVPGGADEVVSLALKGGWWLAPWPDGLFFGGP